MTTSLSSLFHLRVLFLQLPSQGVPALNVNVGAVILAGVLAIAGAVLGVVVRLFKGEGMMNPMAALGLMQQQPEKKERGKLISSAQPTEC